MRIGEYNMDCEFIKENAEEFIKEGFLKEEFNKHLETCRECREYIFSFKKLFSMYPDFEKDFSYPCDLEEKIKKSLKNIENTAVL